MKKPGPAVVCLMGPTASGKTDLALALAEKHPFEIVSVDSAMVYREMDIGTAKPEREVRERVPHHLIDIRDPARTYSAAMFREDVIAVVEAIAARGRIPLLVGGTMLYFKALKSGLADLPAADSAIRAAIQQQADEEGWPAIHARLAAVDPEAARRINPGDPQRLQRALEIFEISGRPMTELHRMGALTCPFPLHEFALLPPDRADLHQRIQARFLQMLERGFIDEVSQLRARGDLHPDLPAMKAVGYRQVWEYLDDERRDFDEMVSKAVAATRQLAKRQYTWLRSWSELSVLDEPEVRVVLKKLASASIL